jgi:hypothetical protein
MCKNLTICKFFKYRTPINITPPTHTDTFDDAKLLNIPTELFNVLYTYLTVFKLSYLDILLYITMLTHRRFLFKSITQYQFSILAHNSR